MVLAALRRTVKATRISPVLTEDRDMPIPKEKIRFTAVSEPEVIADSRVRRFKISSSAVARDGHTLATTGWDLSNFLNNPIVLAAHDSEHIESVIGRAVGLPVRGDDLFADIEFMPGDINPLAEMTMQMVDAGFLRATSVGFIPMDGKPAMGRGKGAYDFSKQELLEISIVPVGSLPDALLAARAAGIDTNPALDWAKRIVRDAGASAVPNSTSVDLALAVEASSSFAAGGKRAKGIMKRDLSDCGWLAQLLQSLACLEEMVEWEAEYEGDNSPVPGMLADAIKTLGGILIAMTAEEVSELIGEEVAEERATDTPGQRAMKALGRAFKPMSTVSIQSFDFGSEVRSAVADAFAAVSDGTIIRSGRILSSDNERCIRDAHGKISEAAEVLMSVVAQVEPSADDAPEQDDPEAVERTARAMRERKMKLAKAIASNL